MHAQEQVFLEFKRTAFQLMLPLFQRRYRWDLSDAQNWYRDILRAGRSSDATYLRGCHRVHRAGTLLCWRSCPLFRRGRAAAPHDPHHSARGPGALPRDVRHAPAGRVRSRANPRVLSPQRLRKPIRCAARSWFPRSMTKMLSRLCSGKFLLRTSHRTALPPILTISNGR